MCGIVGGIAWCVSAYGCCCVSGCRRMHAERCLRNPRSVTLRFLGMKVRASSWCQVLALPWMVQDSSLAAAGFLGAVDVLGLC